MSAESTDSGYWVGVVVAAVVLLLVSALSGVAYYVFIVKQFRPRIERAGRKPSPPPAPMELIDIDVSDRGISLDMIGSSIKQRDTPVHTPTKE